MATDQKISQLSSGAPAQATDETVIARGGANYKLTVANIVGYLGTPITVANGGTGAATLTGVVKGNGTSAFTAGTVSLTSEVTGTLPVANGGTGVTTSTGTGNVVLSTSPTLTTPLLGTPTSGNLSNCTADGTNAVGYRNVPRSGTAKTGSYTLATGDVGEFIEVGSGGSVTIPDATFALGDVVSVFNNTSGNITITCTITTAYIAGTDADKATVTLATRGVATILFLSGTVCVISGNVS